MRVCLKALYVGLLLAPLAVLRLGAQGNPDAAKIQNPVPASPASIADRQADIRPILRELSRPERRRRTRQRPYAAGARPHRQRLEARIDRRRNLQHDQERRRARLQHGRIRRSAEGRGRLERRELRAIAGEKEIGREGRPTCPTRPIWLTRSYLPYFESGSGRTWNFTSLLVSPLPPSPWNGARVDTDV